ncbi:hypothetical protein J437_LFUL001506 [Ladona fulva]|uniref:Uncharacterized protein n=1 Tax=Ladona fulva TaxID=123851 RepID=A0A8K0JW58_LADFU|nr:hypothetical protein J437_LFUL001506 [Ladona fulva]
MSPRVVLVSLIALTLLSATAKAEEPRMNTNLGLGAAGLSTGGIIEAPERSDGNGCPTGYRLERGRCRRIV